MTATLRRVWQAQRTRILELAILGMSVAALIWLSYEFWRLLFQAGYWGAIDLLGLHRASARWFADANDASSRGYPPATFILLFPLLNLFDENAVRWVWAFITLVSLAGLIGLSVHASGASSRRERVFIALVPLSMYASGATIGNGQLGLFVLLLVLYAIRWMQRVGWRADLGALVFLASLVKPSISAPFGWMVLLVGGKFRHALSIGVGYIFLTWLASGFKKISLPILLQSWIGRGVSVAGEIGTSNLSIWLGALGLKNWILPAALAAFAALGVWVWRHRAKDLWLLLGVTALVARLWIYHAWYDDVLILLPLIALYRAAKNISPLDSRGALAGVLFALTLLFSIAPGGLYLLPEPWNGVYVATQVGIWMMDLIFLAFSAPRAQSLVWQPPAFPS